MSAASVATTTTTTTTTAQQSDEALKKYFIETQGKIIDTNRQLAGVSTQIHVKEREKKLCELTVKEVKGVTSDTVLYKSVGKMFLQVPYPVMTTELTLRIESLKDDVTVLSKKKTYLEKSIIEHQHNLKELLEKRR